MIITVTLNPALDKTVEIPDFSIDAVGRITKMRTDPGGKGLNVSKVIAKLGGASVADACEEAREGASEQRRAWRIG